MSTTVKCFVLGCVSLGYPASGSCLERGRRHSDRFGRVPVFTSYRCHDEFNSRTLVLANINLDDSLALATVVDTEMELSADVGMSDVGDGGELGEGAAETSITRETVIRMISRLVTVAMIREPEVESAKCVGFNPTSPLGEASRPSRHRTMSSIMLHFP